jgi:hypothetical protein
MEENGKWKMENGKGPLADDRSSRCAKGACWRLKVDHALPRFQGGETGWETGGAGLAGELDDRTGECPGQGTSPCTRYLSPLTGGLVACGFGFGGVV